MWLPAMRPGTKQTARFFHRIQLQQLSASAMYAERAVAAALHEPECDQRLHHRHADRLNHISSATPEIVETAILQALHLPRPSHAAILRARDDFKHDARFDRVADRQCRHTKFLGDRDRQNRPKDGHGKPHAADSGDRPIIEMTNRRRKPEVLLAPLRNHGIGRKYSPGHQLTLACAKAPADAPSSASSSQP